MILERVDNQINRFELKMKLNYQDFDLYIDEINQEIAYIKHKLSSQAEK